jgi:hypothetical protein
MVGETQRWINGEVTEFEGYLKLGEQARLMSSSK